MSEQTPPLGHVGWSPDFKEERDRLKGELVAEHKRLTHEYGRAVDFQTTINELKAELQRVKAENERLTTAMLKAAGDLADSRVYSLEHLVYEVVQQVQKDLHAALAAQPPAPEPLSDEDREDLAAACEALKDPTRIPWEQVKAELGLDKPAPERVPPLPTDEELSMLESGFVSPSLVARNEPAPGTAAGEVYEGLVAGEQRLSDMELEQIRERCRCHKATPYAAEQLLAEVDALRAENERLMQTSYAYLTPVCAKLTKERDEANELVKAMQNQLSRLADACDKERLPVNVPVDIADMAIAELTTLCARVAELEEQWKLARADANANAAKGQAAQSALAEARTAAREVLDAYDNGVVRSISPSMARLRAVAREETT